MLSQIFYTENKFEFAEYGSELPPAFRNQMFLTYVRDIEIGIPGLWQHSYSLKNYDKMISHRIDTLAKDCVSLERYIIYIPDPETPLHPFNLEQILANAFIFMVLIAIAGLWIFLMIWGN